ncbi:MAG: GNAT family N-acetyltransferase [Candidatus Glassbacteria bacterium]
MVMFKEARAIHELESLEADWKKLQQLSEKPNVFQSYEWISLWWKHFGSGKDLRVVFASEGGMPIFAAPFFVEKTRKIGLSARRITVIGDGLSSQQGFLTVGDVDAALMELFRNLLMREDRWDYLELDKLPEDGRVIRSMRKASEAGGVHFVEIPASRYPYIKIEGDYQDYLKKNVSKRLRKTIRNRINRVKKVGELRFLHTDEIDLEESFKEIISLGEQGWKHRAGIDPLTSGKNREFFRDLLKLFRDSNMLSLTAIELNGKKVAFDLSFVMRDSFYAYYMVFDERFNHLSPGKVIVSHVVERLFSNGMSEIDLSEGEEDYKLEWTKTSKQYMEAYILNKKSQLYPLLLAWLLLRKRLKSSPVFHGCVLKMKRFRRKRVPLLPSL